MFPRSMSKASRLEAVRLNRRRFLRTTAGGSAALAFLAACGGDDSNSGATGATGNTVTPGATGATGGAGASGAYAPGSVWSASNQWMIPDETAGAVRGGVYRGYETTAQSGTFDALVQRSSQMPFAPHVLELLMGRNRGPGIDPASLEATSPAPMLAESWELTDEGATISFKMREGVKWHNVDPVNGRTMDIDDLRLSLERNLEAGVYRSVLAEFLDNAEYPDATHMVWKLKAPYAPIFDRIYSERFGFFIMPKELTSDPRLAETKAIGTGFKVLDNYQPEVTFEYAKHAEYWGGEPFIDRWQIPIIPEYANRYAQFVADQVMDFKPTARDVLQIQKDAPGAIVVARPISDLEVTRMRFGRQNPQDQIWADPRVRVALRRAIDFPSIANFLSNRVEFEAAGIPVQTSTMTHLPQNPTYWLDPEKGELGDLSGNYLFSVEEAKKLMAAAGHTDPIPMDYYVALVEGEIPEENLVVQDSLARSGIVDLKVHQVATAAEHDKYRIDGQYDGLIPQSGYTDDADYFISRDYHSKGRAAERELPQAYPDPRIDALGDAQRLALDPAERTEILKDIQRLLAELMPAVPGRHHFTEFEVRWPWMRNLGWGTVNGNWTQDESLPLGVPVPGGHLHWLAQETPNRNG